MRFRCASAYYGKRGERASDFSGSCEKDSAGVNLLETREAEVTHKSGKGTEVPLPSIAATRAANKLLAQVTGIQL
jgi:hypothetical protein